MRRLGIIMAVLASVLYAAFMAAASSIVNTKHDLSVASTGATIKSRITASGGTTEICVFCHTPHTASPDAPLWNRANPVGSYTTYTSDVLSALNYPSIEDPLNTGAAGYQVHVKTRICMSCHDGTIALGSLVNLPSGMTSPIQMQGTVGGRIPSTATGYIGTDLRDDHPVAVPHDPTKDPELQAMTGSNVRVYTIAAGRVTPTNINGGYVECTSCHDVHDNQFGNFLIDDNTGSKICRSCHNKTGVDSLNANESIHSNTTYSTPYAPPSLGSSVQNVKCMDCHFPHRAGITIGSTSPNPGAGKYNLTYQEEQTCYNTTNRWGQVTSVCHGTGASSTKNIQSEVGKTSAHHVANYSAPGGSPHNATEGYAGAGWLIGVGASWHVECDDCHNSHTAGRLLHVPGTNGVSSTSALWGAGGAEPSWPAGWNVPTTFTYIEPIGVIRASGGNLGVTREYQICFKCHSYFSWGLSGPALAPTPNLSDQAKEFNIQSGGSWHPVTGLNPGRFGTVPNATRWSAGSPFNDNSLMYCSDCHGTESTLNPQGPHGSLNSAITVSSPNMNSYGIQNGGSAGKQPASSLCFKCHDPSSYNDDLVSNPTSTFTGFRTAGNLNLHNRHAFLAGSPTSTIPNKRSYVCANCHTRNAHGFRRPGLVVFRGDGVGEPYPAAYEAGGGGTGLIDNTSNLSRGAYGATKDLNCTTALAVGCHQ